MSLPSSPVTVADADDACPSCDAIEKFLQEGGHTCVKNRISVSTLATELGLRHPYSLLKILLTCNHLFELNDHDKVNTASVYAINALKVTLRSKCSLFGTWHTREFQLVQGGGFTLLLRSSGGQLRQSSVVTSTTTCVPWNSGIIISHLEPEKTYHLESASPDNGAKIGEWVACLQNAIKNLQNLAPQAAAAMESEVECKNPVSLTWHRRTFGLVRAGGHCFILRKMGTKLRGVAAVLKDTTAVGEGSLELRITSLLPQQSFHLKFTEKGERDKWLENFHSLRQRCCMSSVTADHDGVIGTTLSPWQRLLAR